mmetsp:Transcript_19197/g.18338  ORF Transcript_19197/g.18338 Transcript_19197/m.18338 type:complete len:84 (+) Transcript_19197:169-420(+)
MAACMWEAPANPTCYFIQEYDVSKAQAYLAKLNSAQDKIKYTLTHIFVRGFAFGMDKMRRDIGRIRWGNFIASDEMGITVLVD